MKHVLIVVKPFSLTRSLRLVIATRVPLLLLLFSQPSQLAFLSSKKSRRHGEEKSRLVSFFHLSSIHPLSASWSVVSFGGLGPHPTEYTMELAFLSDSSLFLRY